MTGKNIARITASVVCGILLCAFLGSSHQQVCENTPVGWQNIAVLEQGRQSGMKNACWAHDAYKNLETLDAGKAVTIAQIEGPAVITRMHIIRHFITIKNAKLSEQEKKMLAARGIMFEVYYNDNPVPAIRVPLGDFFTDGCGGKADYFSTPFIEIAPNSYNCFIPMPFEKSVKVVLRNETTYDFDSYCCVEFEQLPKWNNKLGYLHATWKRFAFQLYGETDKHFFHIKGKGHLLGRNWSVCTDEPFFKHFHFVMEGNNEVRVDGEKQPSIDYLGSECSFGFCGGYPFNFHGLYNGINFVKHDKSPFLVSVYRFRGADVIRFNKSLDWRVDWTNEFKGVSEGHDNHIEQMAKLRKKDRGWVDYAVTTYWYQDTVGYEHGPIMPLADRIKPVLHPNPVK